MRKIKVIFLIDDDVVSNFLNEAIITDLEITDNLKIFENGLLGIDYLKANCLHDAALFPELIIIDHHMPVMDGMEFMQNYIQLELPAGVDTKFILLAAHSDTKDVKNFGDLGIQEFTSKPLSPEKLMEVYKRYWS